MFLEPARSLARRKALILSRPAWLDAPDPANLKIIRALSSWPQEGGPQRVRERLLAAAEYHRILAVSRDNAASILRQLERPSVEGTIATLAGLPGGAAQRLCASPHKPEACCALGCCS